MEKYKIIDINEFDRSEYFQYFMSVGTTIEITVKVDVTRILPQLDLPPNVFNVSSIPWIHFEHFSSNTNDSGNQLTTMITTGKYV
ncbi:CatA-like O-acetyltransferase [Metaclostridioides mangenotii]|uniref:Chloramphenicol O-acetyltransferase n=1 Tax=Metaclostridioides mangenotii TaxID=1540 RepID=A0ABS4EAY2_9FIRM|nr:CatA-like O-acetyltransferase [Clostridioides mangenotii]MBP1855066.1 chloramphenicol O-acetyltransferase [Clostridioides mangenotii]